MGEAGEEQSRLKIRKAGDRAVLIELDRAIEVSLLHAAARAVRNLPGVLRCTPGHSSLLVVSSDRLPDLRLLEAIAGVRPLEESGKEHVVEVSFEARDAPDLPLLLEHAATTRDHFLDRISQLTFTARHLGFRPGFAYLDGVPEAWRLPRRETPRDFVPRGSFAVAGAAAGFYPDASPGGWNLLGRTDALLWDPGREPPNLIAPGDRVRIVPRS